MSRVGNKIPGARTRLDQLDHSSRSPRGFAVVTRAKNGGANPHRGGARTRRLLKVAGHAHRELERLRRHRKPRSDGLSAGREGSKASGVASGTDRHQAGDAQAFAVGRDGGREFGRLLCEYAPLRPFPRRGVDLHQHGERLRPLERAQGAVEPGGELERVNRLDSDQVWHLREHLGLVRLELADEAPSHVARHLRRLRHQLLDVVLAKVAHSRVIRFA
mmetsp:Transcript_40303/g.132790  ORF Transcript_40303/g.132790 Transcript_40303/m.132790 type:complete len:218 (-) Transcript_40303:109-762(-)